MERATPSLRCPLTKSASDDAAEERTPHRQHFQHPCVKVLLNTSRGSESSTLNDGIVHVVSIVYVRNDLQIFDDDPQLAYRDYGDAMPNERCVERRIA